MHRHAFIATAIASTLLFACSQPFWDVEESADLGTFEAAGDDIVDVRLSFQGDSRAEEMEGHVVISELAYDLDDDVVLTVWARDPGDSVLDGNLATVDIVLPVANNADTRLNFSPECFETSCDHDVEIRFQLDRELEDGEFVELDLAAFARAEGDYPDGSVVEDHQAALSFSIVE
ncbi:MAG TPA: hypothetical protein QGF58_18240 [Myxococcota bacterium]|nr:hypothetical protein [Myxococcota bacterium]